MNVPGWRTARDQLEEMFHVSLSLPKSLVPDEKSLTRVGVLIYNGHPNSNVAPSMNGWVDEQKKDHNREYVFMHIDSIVQWIADKRLWNEFRAALAEVGINEYDNR